MKTYQTLNGEGLVAHAFSVFNETMTASELARSLAKVQFFDKEDSEPIDPELRAVIATALMILRAKLRLSTFHVNAALAVANYKDMRELISSVSKDLDLPA